MYPLISVIIPVYKVEKYLAKCVESVINQTYDNLEIILVNDGSPDNCPEICGEFAKKDSRIKVIHKINGGLSSARNAGLDIAKGKYISFVDSDDYIDSHFIEKLYERIIDDNSDMSMCMFMRIDENGKPIPSVLKSVPNRTVDPEQFWNIELTDGWWSRCVVSWNKLYKADIWENLRFPVGKYNEDEFVIKDVVTKCSKISMLSDELYYYLVRSDSIMGEYNVKRLDGVEASLKRCGYFIKNKQTYFAKATLHRCVKLLLEGYQKLDMQNPENSRRYSQLRNCFKKLYRKLFSIKDVSKMWASCTLYYISEELYLGLKGCYSVFKKCRSVFGKIYKMLKYMGLFMKLFFTRNKAVLMLTPLHGNIGDQAITLGELEYFNNNFKNLKLIEIPSGFVLSRFWNKTVLKAVIRKNDLVLIHGGGFLGTLWIEEEKKLRKVLSALSKRNIVIMPQTVFYDDNENGRNELKTSQEIYSKCRNLSVFLREKYSYEFFRKNFPKVDSYLVPDMVLQLDKYEGKVKKRKGILLCLRNDIEKTQDVNDEVRKSLEYLHEEFIPTDTVVDRRINKKNRKSEVNRKLKEFASAKLIVTDRLHGMVLSAIAQTPCIVVLSKSHKVKGVYEWIKNLDYIELVEDVSKIQESAQKVLSVENPCYDNSKIKKYFVPLTDKIKELLGE